MPRVKNERRKVLVSFLKEEWEEYFELQKTKNYSSFNECIRMLCKAGIRKIEPTYEKDIKLKSERQDQKGNLSEEDKIKIELERNVLREKVKNEKKINEGRLKCELLGGTEVMVENSTIPHCEYNTYIENNDRESVRAIYNKCPIEDLKQWDIDGQYQDFVNQRGPEITERLKKLPIRE